VASLAVDRGDVVGMRILLDVGVAVVALQAAVNALAELLAIDCNAVSLRILHGLIAVAGEAICLGPQSARGHGNQEGHGADCVKLEPACDQAGKGSIEKEWSNEQKCSGACGLVHSAVFFLDGEVGHRSTRMAFPQRISPLFAKRARGEIQL